MVPLPAVPGVMVPSLMRLLPLRSSVPSPAIRPVLALVTLKGSVRRVLGAVLIVPAFERLPVLVRSSKVPDWMSMRPELVKLTLALPVPRVVVPAPVLLRTPVLERVREPGLLQLLPISEPDRLRVPALEMALVPASSSTRPVMLTVPPALICRVRPARELPWLVPDKVRVAAVGTTTVPPPLHCEEPLPLQVWAPAPRVRMPEPPSTPPVWVRVPTEVAALNSVVPPDRFRTSVLTCGVKEAMPPLVTMAPLWLKFAVGMAKLTEPPEVAMVPRLSKREPASRPSTAPPVWNVAPELRLIVPELEPLPAAKFSTPAWTLEVPELVKLTLALPVPRVVVPAPVLLRTPVLERVREPGLLQLLPISEPDRLRVPALEMALVPASSSTRPVMLTVPPALICRVRPARELPWLVPDKVRVAAVGTTTVPPPLHCEEPLPLQVWAPAPRVRMPEPPSTPPVWLRAATVTLPEPPKLPPCSAKLPKDATALSTVNVPDVCWTLFAFKVPPWRLAMAVPSTTEPTPLLSESALRTRLSLPPPVVVMLALKLMLLWALRVSVASAPANLVMGLAMVMLPWSVPAKPVLMETLVPAFRAF